MVQVRGLGRCPRSLGEDAGLASERSAALALTSPMAAGRRASVKCGEAERVCQRPITGVARVTSLMGHLMLLPTDNAVRAPLIRQPSSPMVAPLTRRRHGTLPAAGGRARSCGPGCAARVAAAPAAQRCTSPPIHSRMWRRSLEVSFYRPFSSRSSVTVSAGLQTGSPPSMPDVRRLLTSLRAWESERYPSEGTAVM